MGDSVASPLRVSEYTSLRWIFKCTSWQYDRLLDGCQFGRLSWDSVLVFCNVGDPCGLPPDIIVIQFRYRIGDIHVLPVSFWMRKDVVIGSSSELNHLQMNCIIFKLSIVFKQMNPEYTSDMIQEVIDVARTLASMPRNIGREGLSFVYEVSAMEASFKIIIDSLPRVKISDDISRICTVCCDEISKGEEVIWLPCFHVYHGECILPWLDTKPTCPLCLLVLPKDTSLLFLLN